MAELVKAQIIPEAPGKVTDDSRTGSPIPVMFNPESVSIVKSNTWTGDNNKSDAPTQSFTKGDPAEFKFSKLIFDTTDRLSDSNRSVAVHTDALLELMRMDDAKKRPPWIRFVWGPISSFTAVITMISIEFTYFAQDGTPLRAEVDMALKQFRYDNDWRFQNPTSLTPDPGSLHQVVIGETLESIAFKHYGRRGQWRDIATHNRILDPLSLAPGTYLIIPEQKAVSHS